MKFSSVAALVSLLTAVTALPVADAAADPLFARLVFIKVVHYLVSC
jgi:hypothetical protein